MEQRNPRLIQASEGRTGPGEGRNAVPGCTSAKIKFDVKVQQMLAR
jgi:hypothetical protein